MQHIRSSELKEGYRNFIVHSWLNSYKNSPEFKYMRSSMYKAHYWDIISNIVENSNSEFLLDYEDGNKDKLKGYCVFSELLLSHQSKLHSGVKCIISYLYVTKINRGQGIATKWVKRLSDGEFVYFSSLTPQAVSLCKKNNLEHIYLPYLR